MGWPSTARPFKERREVYDAPAGVFLEEFLFPVSKGDTEVATKVLGHICSQLADLSGIALAQLQQRLVIVHDDRFRWFAEHATPKAAHIKLKESKEVEFGPWYEETLAPDTVLALPVEAEATRVDSGAGKPGTSTFAQLDAAATYQFCRSLFASRPYLRIGGNETLGMGWCEVKLLDGAPT